jgi:hypothetical protein
MSVGVIMLPARLTDYRSGGVLRRFRASLGPIWAVLGSQVLYYGHGDGTWPAGKPGFLFCLDIEMPDGTKQRVVSDGQWQRFARA